MNNSNTGHESSSRQTARWVTNLRSHCSSAHCYSAADGGQAADPSHDSWDPLTGRDQGPGQEAPSGAGEGNRPHGAAG